MAQRKPIKGTVARSDQPVFVVPSEDGTSEEYFFSEEEADAARDPDTVAKALALAGAWSDLDWEEMLEALDRIRHESVPTPPIDAVE
jgi:hypothetical protein